MKFYVKHNGKDYEFECGAKCHIFECGAYNDIPKDKLLEYVEFVYWLYLKADGPIALGHLSDYIAENWDDVQGKDKWEILDGFYMSL